MVAHEDAAAVGGNILKSADLNPDTRSAYPRIRDPHRNAVKQTDVPNQQRIGNTDNPGNRAQCEINKNQFEGGEHTTFQHTAVASRPADQTLGVADLCAAMAAGTFW
jgi:hypothetical protein